MNNGIYVGITDHLVADRAFRLPLQVLLLPLDHANVLLGVFDIFGILEFVVTLHLFAVIDLFSHFLSQLLKRFMGLGQGLFAFELEGFPVETLQMLAVKSPNRSLYSLIRKFIN